MIANSSHYILLMGDKKCIWPVKVLLVVKQNDCTPWAIKSGMFLWLTVYIQWFKWAWTHRNRSLRKGNVKLVAAVKLLVAF